MIFLIIIISILNAYIDYKIIKYSVEIDHKVEAVIRFIIFLGLSSFVASTFFKLITYIALFSSIFWIVFEVTLNKLRKKNLLYIGQTAWSDKLIRKVFKSNAELALLTIKIIILCLLISIQVFF